MPVNTVSRRLGISTLTSLRLFTRAPCTLIRSWLSAACGAAGVASSLVAMLLFLHLVAGPLSTRSAVPYGQTGAGSLVLDQSEDVAVGVGELGYQPAAADVVRRL